MNNLKTDLMKRIFLLLTLLAAVACNRPLRSPVVRLPSDWIHRNGLQNKALPHDLRWWERFGDTLLNRLEETALAQNRNLAVAASRVQAARAQMVITRTDYLPQLGATVTAGGSYSREQHRTGHYALTPTLSWEVSLFEALEHAEQATEAQILATEWAFRGVVLSLTAEVATTCFTLRRYGSDLQTARLNLALRQRSAALIDSMFRYGMSDGASLAQAQSLVHTAAADIPRYEDLIEQNRLALATLLGEIPSAVLWQTRTAVLPAAFREVEVPVGLPSELLTRRPDVMECYFSMREAAAQVGVAHSARFPAISLTADGGIAASSIKGLTGTKPWVWSAAASLTQPIFAFGRLKRREEIAREGYIQSVSNYEQSVFQAFADVETALSAVASLREEARQQQQLVEANQRVAQLSEALYQNGMADYLNVIDAQRELYDSQMQYNDLLAERYVSLVALFKALGGGW